MGVVDFRWDAWIARLVLSECLSGRRRHAVVCFYPGCISNRVGLTLFTARLHRHFQQVYRCYRSHTTLATTNASCSMSSNLVLATDSIHPRVSGRLLTRYIDRFVILPCEVLEVSSRLVCRLFVSDMDFGTVISRDSEYPCSDMRWFFDPH